MFHKKSLGQHFLRNRTILQKIADAASLTARDTVLEVGPGDGVLTAFLLERAGKVVAVEKDERLIPVLQKRFASEIASGKLKLIHGDILDAKWETAPDVDGLQTSGAVSRTTSYKIVANLPYYITGQFLRKFLQSETQPSMMVLLLQKEVARRIVASDERESILSISVKCYGTPQYIGTVKAGSFSPPPKVDSGILKIAEISKKFFHIPPPTIVGVPPSKGESKNSPLPARRSAGGEGSAPSGVRGRDVLDEQKFFEILKRGFAHPRKLLASNLGIVKEMLAQCGVAENARAENVSLEQWRFLTNALTK